jgi:hypothetical protein
MGTIVLDLPDDLHARLRKQVIVEAGGGPTYGKLKQIVVAALDAYLPKERKKR